MSLMLRTIQMLRKICKSFRRKRHSLRLIRLLLSCEQTNRKKINVQWIRTAVHQITAQLILSDTITDHSAQTVIILLIILLSTFFATAFTSLKIVNFFLMSSKMLKRRQTDQLQSSCTGWLQLSCIRSQFTKKKKRDTESLTQKSVTVMMMISSLNLMRKRKSAMKLLLCLRRLSVRCLNLNELQILNSSHT